MQLTKAIKAKRVALVGTTAASMYGFRAGLIKSLVSRGVEVYAYAIDYLPESRSKIEGLGATPLDYALTRGANSFFKDLICTISLARSLKKLAPDLVFCFFSKPVVFGTLAAKFAGVPNRVGMLEGLGFAFTEQPFGLSLKTWALREIQVILYRASFPFLDRLIFLNPDDPVDLIERHRLKVREVSVLGGIGVDLVNYRRSTPILNPLRFIFVGRLLAEKGVREFVEAAKYIGMIESCTEFILLGSIDPDNPGSLRQGELNELVESGVVICPGHVEDVKLWLNKSSVFVLPSYREGVPLSTQEALAMGLPIITTDVPGCRETVIDGVNGFLIPPWSAQALIEKIKIFLNNPALVVSMGLASQSLAVERFDERKVNERLVGLLLKD